MANMEISYKVSLIGVLFENTFTDDVMKHIAAVAQAEKGKKIKLSINNIGIKITRSKMFQSTFVDFYPYEKMKAVTKNPRYGNCVMFIMDGNDKKYKIISVRCPVESNAVDIVNQVTQFRQKLQHGFYTEFSKRENGNWTLRERSAHNANMHLNEIFKEQEQKAAANETTVVNGGVHYNVHYLPILDASKDNEVQIHNNNNNTRSSYIKRNGSVTRDTMVVARNDITGEIQVLKEEGVKDESDYNDLIDHVKVADALTTSRRGSMIAGNTVATEIDMDPGPNILRATSHRTEYAHVAPRYQIIPNGKHRSSHYVAHRRVSGDMAVLPQRMDNRIVYSRSGSLRSNARVQFDNVSVASGNWKSQSMRTTRPASVTSTDLSMPTTIQRNIEETYARPVIVQHRNQGTAVDNGNTVITNNHHHHHHHHGNYSRSRRPHSIHVMSGNELKVYSHGGTTEIL